MKHVSIPFSQYKEHTYILLIRSIYYIHTFNMCM